MIEEEEEEEDVRLNIIENDKTLTPRSQTECQEDEKV